METIHLLSGTIHPLPDDLAQRLLTDAAALKVWNDITPLARNEWICLVISGKKQETRDRRLKRTIDQLSRGQRRPCCWEGCLHRERTARS